MKRWLISLSWLAVIPMVLCLFSPENARFTDRLTGLSEIFVAPDGDNSSSGTLEQPLASLSGARDRLRAWRAAGTLPPGGVTVYLRGGIYPISQTVVFEDTDSATASQPVTYRAYPGEQPVLSGGVDIPGSKLANLDSADPHYWRLPTSAARQAVVTVDLFDNGLSYQDLDYASSWWQSGNHTDAPESDLVDYRPHRMVFTLDETALHPARYPNLAPTEVHNIAARPFLHALRSVTAGGDGVTKAAFVIDQERVKHWQSYEDVVVEGPFTAVGYVSFRTLMESFDPVTATVTLASARPWAALYEQASRYAFENVFEELDAPGEYYIDKHTGRLYFYPPTAEFDGLKIARFDGDFLVDLTDVSYTSFQGIVFESSKGSLLKLSGGEHCTVSQSTFQNFGVYGMRIGQN
ncbi:MAG: hypothetical protein LBG70_00590, partial [Bifidobacteriaceae bacterium]|nr:hypothetical protein [Bifidobacteriaceae bacterium]